jgi:hypothetical protein
MEEIVKIIDVEKAVRSSNSKFVRSLPKLIISLIEKLIHQDEMNPTIHRYLNKSGVPFLNDILNEWKVNVVVKGVENVPVSGRFVLVAKHPVNLN